MRAVVVYESMYGNTHQVAEAIGAGLGTAFDASVVLVSQAGPEVLAGTDLVVAGGPTHAHGMSRAATRKAAVEAAGKPVSGLKLTRAREWGTKLAETIVASKARGAAPAL